MAPVVSAIRRLMRMNIVVKACLPKSDVQEIRQDRLCVAGLEPVVGAQGNDVAYDRQGDDDDNYDN
jgi:hypothetical protein